MGAYSHESKQKSTCSIKMSRCFFVKGNGGKKAYPSPKKTLPKPKLFGFGNGNLESCYHLRMNLHGNFILTKAFDRL